MVKLAKATKDARQRHKYQARDAEAWFSVETFPWSVPWSDDKVHLKLSNGTDFVAVEVSVSELAEAFAEIGATLAEVNKRLAAKVGNDKKKADEPF